MARFANSICSPNRFKGILFFNFFLILNPGGANLFQAPSVINGPGAIAFVLILYFAHSTANDLVIAKTPALAEAEGTTYPDPVQAYVVTIFKIFPLFCLIISLPTASVQLNVPVRTISTTALNPPGDSISVGDIKLPAALFIKISILPNLFNEFFIILST